MDTQPAAMTGVRILDKSLLSAVDEQLDATNNRERGFFVRGDGTDRENVVRANGNAWPGGFAAHRVDGRNHEAGAEFAVRFDIMKD